MLDQLRTRRVRTDFIRLTIFVLAFIGLVQAQAQCPSWTKKETPAADSSKWPAGHVVFFLTYDASNSSPKGLYITTLTSWTPTVIPNTATEKINQVSYSSDGAWLLYHVASGGTRYAPIPGKWYFIKPDGTGKTTVPIGDPIEASLYRNSPYGTEIAYVSNSARTLAKAMKVDFSSGFPDFGDSTSRTIVDFTSGGCNISVEAINSDQIMGRMNESHNGSSVSRTTYVTIPDSGRGIARTANIYKWKNDIYEDTLYGCGHTFSYDGSLALANAGSMGSSCVPNKRQSPPMDHKGFYITPFRHYTDSAMTVIENTDVYGTSINWCPEEYRLGIWSDVNNGNWMFSNNSDFVVGTIEGPLAINWGVWIIEWQPNTWTMISPGGKTKTYGRPAIFLSDPVAVRRALSGINKNKASHALVVRKFTDRTVIQTKTTGASARILALNGTVIKNLTQSPSGFIWDYTDNRARRIPSGIYIISVGTPASMVRQPILVN